MENKSNFNNDEFQESELLKSMKNNNVFSVPENYFENLPSAVSDRIHANQHKAGIFSGSAVRWVSFAGIAVIAIISGAIYFNRTGNEKSADQVVSTEQIVNSGELATIDESLLFEELQSRIASESEVAEQEALADNEHFEEYLIENNTDINLIITEL